MRIIKSETLNCEVNYILDEFNEPWFFGKSIATTLGYTDSRKALADHVDEADKKTREHSVLLGDNLKTFIIISISEFGLYSLIMSSKLPTAKAYRKWITNEVLPTIRKNAPNNFEDRRLKLEEMRMLKELTELNNNKMTTVAIDGLINMINNSLCK